MTLKEFIRESNRIEGIIREPTEAELTAAELFLGLARIEIADLCNLVSVFQPGAVLRDKPGLNVRVGNHIAPAGGKEIKEQLQNILDHLGRFGSYKTHLAYEMLHPFTDGNGRSGRMLWAWQMGETTALQLGFLHRFYYQTLDQSRKRG